MTDTNKRPVSPVNGQPLPRGKPFTSETAREAAQKSNKVQSERKSIAAAFKKNMSELHTIKENGEARQYTGAEIIARSIMTACNKGNANAMNIALALMGEKPAENINIVSCDFTALDSAFEGLSGGDPD